MYVVSFAQVNSVVNPYPKTISVTGSAEMEIVPDEIFVQVQLSEYEKKGTGKIGIETIKKQFLEACKAAGIADSLISVDAYQGNSLPAWLQKKKKTPDMMASVSYLVKFKNTKAIDALVEKLDDQATQNFFIARTSHSKIEQYRKQLKMEAIKAAKVKATYLTEAIGEHVGPAVTIQEPEEYSPVSMYQKHMVENINLSNSMIGDGGEPAIDFTKIKLQYKVHVVFSLF